MKSRIGNTQRFSVQKTPTFENTVSYGTSNKKEGILKVPHSRNISIIEPRTSVANSNILSFVEQKEVRKSLDAVTDSNIYDKQLLIDTKKQEKLLKVASQNLIEKREIKAILENEQKGLEGHKAELLIKSNISFHNTPETGINKQQYTLKKDFNQFKEKNNHHITAIRKNCEKNVKTMMSKVSSLKQEVENLEVVVQGKRINERIGTQGKVVKFDSDMIKQSDNIDGIDLKIKQLTEGNKSKYYETIGIFEKLKLSYDDELIINKELQQRCIEIRSVVEQLSRSTRKKRSAIDLIDQEIHILRQDLQHIDVLNSRSNKLENSSQEIFTNQKIKASKKNTKDIDFHSRSSTSSVKQSKHTSKSKQKKHKALERMLYDAIKLTYDKIFEFENVIDIFVGDHSELLLGKQDNQTIPNMPRNSQESHGIYRPHEKEGQYTMNSTNKDFVPYTQSDEHSPTRQKFVRGMYNRKTGLNASEDHSFDREKRAILNVCNDLSREMQKMKSKLDNTNEQ